MSRREKSWTWQHGHCLGYAAEADMPSTYLCELCRPDLYPDLLKCVESHLNSLLILMPTSCRKFAKRARQASTTSNHARAALWSSRSRSPTHLLKPTKRRNKMNGRDDMYEEPVKAALEASATEAAAQES